jgi:DNA helicase-2/ATP-dependent DNA helicase PcrA
MYEPRVSRIQFVNGRSARGIAARDISRHYFSEPGVIYLDKISKFACEVIRLTDGRPLRRFEQIFHYLFLDECQDLAGADLDLIRHLLSSRTQIILVGDHRQATFATNNAARNARYRGTNVIDKFEEWRAEGLCAIECANHSHRCVQPICDFADQFFPDFPKTVSRNERQTDHDGVVAVERRNVDAYMARFSPQCLRYNKTTLDTARKPINFGAAKGLTFERTLIYPHGPLRQFLQTGQVADAGAELSKIYVAVTRARQSVAFVVDNGARLANLELFQPQ